MSETSFYLLPTNKLYKEEKTKRFKNFPAGYIGSFYRNLAENVDNFVGSDFYSQIAKGSDLPEDDVQKYILYSCYVRLRKGIQTGTNHYVN